MTMLALGQVAPRFSLRGIDNQLYTYDTNGARLTLAVFFKPTCPTCALAFPYFETIFQTFRKAGLIVWGVSQHACNPSADFASKHRCTFPILLDADWRVSRLYDPQFVPTGFLIERTGRVIESVVAFDKAGLNRLTQSIAAQLGVPSVTIAANDDGNPPFRPG